VGPKLLLINPAMTALGSSGLHLSGQRQDSQGGALEGLRVWQKTHLPAASKTNGRRLPNAGGFATMEPLALAYVAALTPPHWEVRLVDEVLEDIPADYEPDLVALGSLSTTVPRAYEIAQHYRERRIPVVMGGVHATLLPDEAEQYVDVVFQGEAEGKWPLLIRDFEEGGLRRRYNGAAPVLCGLPQPRRDVYRRGYFLQLLSASRGCRYRCEFCTLWKLEAGRYRARPPAEVWEELKATESKRPLLFTDENVFIDRNWALSLFRGMGERQLQRRYAVQASLDIADDDEMLAALKQSGCMTVLVGFESVSEASLRMMRKAVNLKVGVANYKEKIAKLHDHGLASSGTFIFGNDGDEPDIFERTVEFVLEAGLDLAHFGLLTPMPGTDLYDRLEKEGRLLYTNFPSDYARYDQRTVVFRPRRMTPEQLEQGLIWATRSVGAWSAVIRRAWNTFRMTRSPVVTGITLLWNRSGLYRRVMD
jgi:radical SAM superfamily enzyme YgiQ (UPF0313 family)